METVSLFQLKKDGSRVCLLLLDMYTWNFTKRDDVTYDRQQVVYEAADLTCNYFQKYKFFYFLHKQKFPYHVTDADKCVRSYAIKLAAEIQRIRIKHGVLHLSHLLPEHLKDNRVSNSVKNPITYGWINSYKIM